MTLEEAGVKQDQVFAVLNVIWASGGFAFGGTSRDLVRGELPNDLDVRLGHDGDMDNLRRLGSHIENDRQADHGEAYYDKKIVFDGGLQVHIKYGWCSVTDCSCNLLRLYKDKVDLLYVPKYLEMNINPLHEVLKEVHRKEFVPLEECEPHRRYRWDEFIKRGWTKLTLP